jgi:hypothetical protein
MAHIVLPDSGFYPLRSFSSDYDVLAWADKYASGPFGVVQVRHSMQGRRRVLPVIWDHAAVNNWIAVANGSDCIRYG